MIRAKTNATSTSGFCRPVSTLASLTGSGNGSRTKETLTVAMRSVVRVMTLSLDRDPTQGQESEPRSRMRTVG